MAALPPMDAHRLVLVDGVVAPSLSGLSALEGGVRVQTLREVLEDNTAARADLLENGAASGAMISLNSAMATDGAVITVANGTVLTKPLHVLHVATRSSAATYTRSYLKLGNAAHATLVESFVAAGETKSYQTNDAVIVWLGNDAHLQHVRLMADSADAANVTTAIFTLGAKARLNAFNMTSGGGVSRYQGYLTFAGEGAEASGSTPTPPCSSITRCRTARAARSSARSSTIPPIRCFRAVSSSSPTRRRPMPR
jgi:Fe-S cluster assembly protein SufD